MLLAPLVGPALTAEPELAALAIRHYQLMLNILRALLAVGIAMLVYLLATKGPWCSGSFSEGGLFCGRTETPQVTKRMQKPTLELIRISLGVFCCPWLSFFS